jgi:hypothetical protein
VRRGSDGTHQASNEVLPADTLTCWTTGRGAPQYTLPAEGKAPTKRQAGREDSRYNPTTMHSECNEL